MLIDLPPRRSLASPHLPQEESLSWGEWWLVAEQRFFGWMGGDSQ